MILLMGGCKDERVFSGLVQLGRQLAAKSLSVAIDENSAPATMDEATKYESIGLLTKIDPGKVKTVLIMRAAQIETDLLSDLHRFQFGVDTRVIAVDRFSDAQALISAQSKLAFALGREPEFVDLTDLHQAPFLESALVPLVYSGLGAKRVAGKPRVLIYVPKKPLKDESWLSSLNILANSPDYDCQVITEAKGKERILRSRFKSISTFGLAEIPVETLAKKNDIMVYFGENIPGARMATLGLEVMGNHGVLIDCTTRAAFAASGAPVIRGPSAIDGLDGFVRAHVLPNLAGIGSEIAKSPWLQRRSVENLMSAAGIQPSEAKEKQRPRRILFVPTNGVGLGHAQRCSQIARKINSKTNVGFAAFPSCVPMLQSKGLDCLTLMQKSVAHSDPYANDLLNYLRLGRTVSKQDHLVFDGGYIFGSIYRTILENDISATWIRRGLWQTGQIERTPMERERAFNQVIVPQEPFDELNTDYSFGTHIHKVGPIVGQSTLSKPAQTELRAKLRKHFNRDFKTLVVSMLGSGAATDRSTQLQTLAAQLGDRPDCLHLVVVWPNAAVATNLFGWDNTFVVRTHNAADLCRASDFVVSAAGYNSVNEALYDRVPTIFIPQMPGFMDNQERRAQAASERGLAATVLSDQLLTLKRELDAFLDGGKAGEISAALSEAKLPETGNAAAARLIEGLNQ